MKSAATSNIRVALVGRGRMGSALAAALGGAGLAVDGPHGRGPHSFDTDVALLCVPDSEIAAAAGAVAPGPVIGHCSGALGLDVLGERPSLALHPLMTVTGAADAGAFAGASCAIAGSGDGTLAIARELARALGMTAFAVADDDRAAYHAAASIASNYLIALEDVAARLAATAGVGADAFAPLVRATVENWAAQGAERALTGPVARGDEVTVERQREAVAQRLPELLALFDELTDATRALTARATTGRGPAAAREPAVDPEPAVTREAVPA